jgi:plastocyanin
MMMKLINHCYVFVTTALSVILLTPFAGSQTVDVSARIVLSSQQEHARSSHLSSANVVIWLTSTQKNPPASPLHKTEQYALIQKGKKFSPHVLVVPTGSSVDFPNLDPFFHNVFSLFNGKRFDLGLYEAHTHRTVQFDREGVSYIFCNIHPEMGAVIVTISTPYYGISKPDGTVILHNVPPGSYRLSVWAENVDNEHLNALSRVVEITPQSHQLGTFQLSTIGDMMSHHRNKFGENYPPASKEPY